MYPNLADIAKAKLYEYDDLGQLSNLWLIICYNLAQLELFGQAGLRLPEVTLALLIDEKIADWQGQLRSAILHYAATHPEITDYAAIVRAIVGDKLADYQTYLYGVT